MAQAIDSRAWSETIASITRLDLLRHNAELRMRVDLLRGARDTPGAHANMRRIHEIVTTFRAFHEQYCLPVSPPELLGGGTVITAFRQKADGQCFTMYDAELLRSGLLAGPTGEGKSTVLYHLAKAARAAGHHVFLITAKREPNFDALAARDDDFVILTPEITLNMTRPDPRLSLAEDVAIKVDSGASALWAAEDYRQVMTTAYTKALTTDPEATMHDVLRVIASMDQKGETWKFRDAIRGARLRHQRTVDRFPGWHTKGAPGLDALAGRSVLLRLRHATETEIFLVTYVLRRVFHQGQEA